MDLIFKDIDVQINSTDILKNVCGVARSGEMLAIMGPSGAGKSTLLSAVAGRMPLSSGIVRLNDELMNKKLSRKIGFVLQHDVFFPNLTLKETFTFAALLTLPDKMPHHLKLLRVDEIIEILELEQCANTIIGNAMMPGLSGGEKKRATIGCEMMTDPTVLLLDEPTSGLDYSIASNLVTTLKRYSEARKKTVVASIHQPSSQMFHMFDNLLLLAEGQVAYFGPNQKILDHFKRIGLTCQPHYNPADFIMEHLRQSKENQEQLIQTSAKHRATDWPSEIKFSYSKPDLDNLIQKGLRRRSVVRLTTTRVNEGNHNDFELSETITEENESNTKANETDLTEVSVEKGAQENILISTDLFIEHYTVLNENSEPEKSPTGFWTQYSILTKRSFKVARSILLSRLKLIQSAMMTFFVALLWFQTERSEKTINDRLGVIFFSIVFWSSNYILEAVGAYPTERPVILRERSSGMYRLSAYWLAKQTSELPLTLCLPTVYCIIVYWSAGLNPSPWVFFVFTLTLVFSSLVVQSVGLFIGAAIVNIKAAYTLSATIMLMFLLAGGFYQRNLDEWQKFMQYLSPMYYSYYICLDLEFEYGPDLKCLPRNETAFHSCRRTSTVSGNEVLRKLNVTLPLWINYVVLLCALCIFRYAAYLMLRYVRKPTAHK